MVARGGACSPVIDEPAFPGEPGRATRKAHTASTLPLSPLRNPGLRLSLMPIVETIIKRASKQEA